MVTRLQKTLADYGNINARQQQAPTSPNAHPSNSSTLASAIPSHLQQAQYRTSTPPTALPRYPNGQGVPQLYPQSPHNGGYGQPNAGYGYNQPHTGYPSYPQQYGSAPSPAAPSALSPALASFPEEQKVSPAYFFIPRRTFTSSSGSCRR